MKLVVGSQTLFYLQDSGYYDDDAWIRTIFCDQKRANEGGGCVSRLVLNERR